MMTCVDLGFCSAVVFIGIDFGESRKRLRSTFAATAEEDQPSDWVCEKEAVKERIITNCNRINVRIDKLI